MRVAVAMSGGVDSLRAAMLLKSQGFDVFGIHMLIAPGPVTGSGAAGTESPRQEEERTAFLRQSVERFGIALEVVDLRDAFEEQIIRPFVRAYAEGLTPNPCVHCNAKIKFGLLMAAARGLGADRFATGHYVRLTPPEGSSKRYRLHRAADAAKDQSYFLYGLNQDQLAAALFPLGTTTKNEVLRWAEAAGLASWLGDESQEICFLPPGGYRDFVRNRRSLSPVETHGPIVDLDGRVLGEHRGLFAYTVGQRRGLGIASTAPYYVVRLEPAANTVVVGRAHELYRREFEVTDINWLSITRPPGPIRADVRIRNQHRPAPAVLRPAGGNTATVVFDQPQRAVTPGQAAVFYDRDVMLGGGLIAPGPWKPDKNQGK